MKTRRLVFFLMVFILVFITLIPAPVNVEAAQAITTAKLKVVNPNKEKVPIQLFGPANYNLVAKVKNTTEIKVTPGKYTYVMTVCGARQTGTLEITKKSQSFKIVACSSLAIFNRTGGPIYLTLKGPWTYTLTIAEKFYHLYVLPGTYKYTVTGCGGVTEKGSIIQTKRTSYRWFFTCNAFED
jgi:hypothetical protein